MRHLLIAAMFLFGLYSCSKQEPTCVGTRATCTHTIFFSYLVCPDPEDSTQVKYSQIQSYTTAEEMSSCDTTAWLSTTRAADEQWKINPDVPTWEAFAKAHPNTCGCR